MATGAKKTFNRTEESEPIYSRFVLPFTQIAGREEILVDIQDIISTKNYCVLCGKKYIGKTSLACSVAQTIHLGRNLYFDFNKSDDVSSQFTDAIYTLSSKQTDTDIGGQFLDVLCNQEIMFVLDNFELMTKPIMDLLVSTITSNTQLKAKFVIVFSSSTHELVGYFEKLGTLINVPGITAQDARLFAEKENVMLTLDDADTLVQRYNGSPAYVQLAIENCKKFFEGKFDIFFQTSNLDYEYVLIDKQFEALEESLQRLLIAIGILDEEVNKENCLKYGYIEKGQYESSLQSLFDLNFVTHYNNELIVLMTPVRDYIFNKTADSIATEILSGEVNLLSKFPLLTNLLSEETRMHQKKLLNIIINNCLKTVNHKELLNRIKKCIIRNGDRSYLAGNLLNIISMFNDTLIDLDFSDSFILEADLSNNEARGINFANTYFEDCVFKNIFGSVTAMHYNKDLSIIATGFFNGLIILWNEQGKQLAEFRKFKNTVNDLKFIGNRLFAACKNGEIREFVFNENLDIEQTVIIAKELGVIRTIAINSQAEMLIVGIENGKVLAFNLLDKEVTELFNAGFRIKALSLSNDGSYLAIGGDANVLYIYSFADNKIIMNLRVNNRWIRCLCFYDDTVVCGGDSGNLNIINIHTNEVNDILKIDRNKIWSLDILKDGNSIITGGDDGTIRIIDLQSKATRYIMRKHVSWVRCLAVSDNYIFSGGEDQTIYSWRLSDYKCYKAIKGYTKRVFSVSIGDGNIYAGLGDHSVVKIDNNTNRTQKLFTCADQVWTIAVKNQILAAGCDKGDVYLYDLSKQRIIFNRHFCGGWIGSVQFDLNGELFVFGDELGDIYGFDISDHYFIEQVFKYHAHNGRVASIKFVKNTIVSVGEDGRVGVFNLNEESYYAIHVCEELLYSIDILDDERLITAGSSGQVYVVYLGTNCVESKFNLGLPIWSIASVNEDKIFFAMDNGDLKYCTILGQQIGCVSEHQNQVWTIVYDKNEKRLVSGGEDSKLVIYNINGEIISKMDTVICDCPYNNVNLSNCHGLSLTQLNYLSAMGAKV